MNQNETIRINVDIDDRDIRNLNDAIRNLNQTLSDLDGTLSSSVGSIQEMLGVTQSTGSSVDTLSSIMSTAATSASMMTFASGKLAKSFENGKGKITGATIAAGGFKLALGGIGFGAAIWGVQQLFSWLGNLGNNTDSTRERLRRLNDTLEENRQAHQRAINEINKNERSSGALITTLLRLNNRTGNLNDERDEAIRIARILNAAENDLNLTYDEQTGFLTGNSVATLEQERNRIAMNASLDRSAQYLESLEEALMAEYNANKENGGELERLRKLRVTLNEKLDEARELGEEGEYQVIAYTAALHANERTYEDLQGTLEEFNNDVEYHYTNWIKHQNEFEQQRAAFIAEHGLSYEILSDQQREVVYKMLERWEMYRDNGQEMFSRLGESTKLFATVTDENGNEVQRSYRELGKTADEVMQSMIENMRQNREATANWSGNLDELAGRTSEAFAQHMREMGVESAWYVQQMLDGCDNLLQELYTGFKESGNQASDNLTGALGRGSEEVVSIVEQLASNSTTTLDDRFKAEFPGIGQKSMEELAYSLLNTGPTVAKAAVANGGSAIEALRKELELGESKLDSSGRYLAMALIEGAGSTMPLLDPLGREIFDTFWGAYREQADENSPSGVFMQSGRNAVAGLVKGVGELQDRPVTRIRQLAENMIRVYNNANRDYTTIGRNTMTGLNQGLLNGEAGIMATARRIANNMRTTMQRALQINSPSRVMREQIGRQIPAGIAAGIDKYADYAIDSVYDLGKKLPKIEIPNLNEIIQIRTPNLRDFGINSTLSPNVDNSVTNNNQGLFEGATINWHGEEDIRRTMEKIAWVTERERKGRMW